MAPGEKYVDSIAQALLEMPDWRKRIHIIPGIGSPFLRSLVTKLCRERVAWLHWSEPSVPGLKSLYTFPARRIYGAGINRFSIGALAIGQLAVKDFRQWGISKRKIAFLPYSRKSLDSLAIIDEKIREFAGGRFVFLFCGSLCHRKGVDVLISAFAEACHLRRDSVLVLVGQGQYQRNYVAETKKHKIADRVMFRGMIPPERIASAMNAADVFVLPSRWDGWGVVLNEAASLGLPLIATDKVGAAYHLIEPLRNGFRVRSGSQDALSLAIKAYGSDPELALRHGSHSLKLFQNFTPEANARRLLRAIKKSLNTTKSYKHF